MRPRLKLSSVLSRRDGGLVVPAPRNACISSPKRRLARAQATLASFAAFAGVLFLATPALADRVAVLKFPPGDSRAQSATEAAVSAQKHEQPSPPEVSNGNAAVQDGQADTSEEYRAFGKAANVDWTLRGTAIHRADGYRLEIEACQVKTGRVELLAREVDETKEVPEIAEMLALLLRPEGIANADLPWQHAQPKPKEPKEPKEPEKPKEPEVPAVVHTYAEGHPLAFGAGLGVLAAVSRPEGAVGSATSLYVGGLIAYHVEQAGNLELRANIAGTVAGPRALVVDVGARYGLPIWPTRRLFFVPDLGIGTFVNLGVAKEARFLFRAAGYLSLGLGERVAVELGPDFGVTPGGAGTVVLFGGTARGLVRF